MTHTSFSIGDISVLAIIVFSKVEALTDNFGTDFVTVFPWCSDEQILYIFIDIINPDKTTKATVQLKYYDPANDTKEIPEIPKFRTIPISVPPESYETHIFDPLVMSAVQPVNASNTGIDKRIYITSDIPVSVVQHSHFSDGVKSSGDSFTVWPKAMAGKQYAFSLPESKNGITVAYILPTVTDTEVHLKVITVNNSTDITVNAKVKESSELQFFYGLSEELTIFANGDNPFHVIVAMQQMLLTAAEHTSAGYGATMLTPIPSNDTFSGCASEPMKDNFDVHYLGLSAAQNEKELFTVTPPADNCKPFTMVRVRRKVWNEGAIQESPYAFELSVKTLINSNELQNISWLPAVKNSTSVLMQSTIALMQILHFGTLNDKGPFLNQVPSYAQFVTGRTYFVIHSVIMEYVEVFTDGQLKFDKNLNIEGTENLQNAVHSMNYTRFSASSPGLYYVESDEKYMVSITCRQSACSYVPSLNSYSTEWLRAGRLYDSRTEKPDSYDTEFVTIVPWNIDDFGKLIFRGIYLINIHPYAPAHAHIVYNDFSYSTPNASYSTKDYSPIKIIPVELNISIPPAERLLVSLPTTVTTRIFRDVDDNLFFTADCRVFISSDLPVTVLQNNYDLTDRRGDTFTVVPMSMAGRRYAFTLPASVLPTAISSAYFLPIHQNVSLEIIALINGVQKHVQVMANAEPNSRIYLFNGGNAAFTLYAIGDAPFLVLISMQRFVLEGNNNNSASTLFTMPLPVPNNKVCNRKPIRDEFDIHYFPFFVGKSSNKYTVTPPSFECDLFNAVEFTDSTKAVKWQLDPNKTQPLHYVKRDSNGTINALFSCNAFMQVLFFYVDKSSGTYIDFIPAYSQYTFGTVYVHVDNDHNEFIIVLSDVDAMKVDDEYYYPDSEIRTPFRTIYYMLISGLKIGIHRFEVDGKYMLFSFFIDSYNYGYVVAFNRPSPESFKPTEVFDEKAKTPDTVDYEFVTVFPWQNDQENPSAETYLLFDLINPHPYMPAEIELLYNEQQDAGVTSQDTLPVKKIIKIPPSERHTQVISSKVRTQTFYYGHNKIYSFADARIYMKSDVAISVLQHNFLEEQIGDTFALLPKSMAGQRYAFSLPKSPVGCNSVYFIPTETDAVINFTVITSQGANNYTVTAKVARNSSFYLYNGSGEAYTIYIWGDAPFLVIISMQEIFMDTAWSSQRGYASTMPLPIPNDACRTASIKGIFDVHYIFPTQAPRATDFFTITPPMHFCEPFNITKYSNVKPSTKWLIEPNTMQSLYYAKHEFEEIIIGMQSSTTMMQVLRFGNDREKMLFADIIPSYTQYLTGRTYFCVNDVHNEFVSILSDTDTVRVDDYYLKPLAVLKGPFYTIYATKIADLTMGAHYVEADGKYTAYIEHFRDLRYAYAIGFNKYSPDTPKSAEIFDAYSTRRGNYKKIILANTSFIPDLTIGSIPPDLADHVQNVVANLTPTDHTTSDRKESFEQTLRAGDDSEIMETFSDQKLHAESSSDEDIKIDPAAEIEDAEMEKEAEKQQNYNSASSNNKIKPGLPDLLKLDLTSDSTASSRARSVLINWLAIGILMLLQLTMII